LTAQKKAGLAAGPELKQGRYNPGLLFSPSSIALNPAWFKKGI